MQVPTSPVVSRLYVLDVQSQEVSSLAMQPGTIPGQTVWAADSSSVITVCIIYTYLQYLHISTLYIYTYLHPAGGAC